MGFNILVLATIEVGPILFDLHKMESPCFNEIESRLLKCSVVLYFIKVGIMYVRNNTLIIITSMKKAKQIV